MEIKRNEATLNRPEGERVLDAPWLFLDIPSFIEQLKDEKQWKKMDRNAITIFKSDNVSIVICALKEGAEIVDKTVASLLTVQVLKGQVEFQTPDGTTRGEKRQIAVFHPGVHHSIKARSRAMLLLTTYGSSIPDEYEDELI